MHEVDQPAHCKNCPSPSGRSPPLSNFWTAARRFPSSPATAREATGALDDTQLRNLEERLRYLRELEDRRKAILDSVREQGKLDAALEAQINDADTKARLEDIYLPYKPKRRTKAQIARENGLEPLADLLLANPDRDPKAEASAYLKDDLVKTPEEALEGARAILVERFCGRRRPDRAAARGFLDARRADFGARRQEGRRREISGLFRFLRAADQTAVASHPAVMRGEREEILDVKMVADPPPTRPCACRDP